MYFVFDSRGASFRFTSVKRFKWSISIVFVINMNHSDIWEVWDVNRTWHASRKPPHFVCVKKKPNRSVNLSHQHRHDTTFFLFNKFHTKAMTILTYMLQRVVIMNYSQCRDFSQFWQWLENGQLFFLWKEGVLKFAGVMRTFGRQSHRSLSLQPSVTVMLWLNGHYPRGKVQDFLLFNVLSTNTGRLKASLTHWTTLYGVESEWPYTVSQTLFMSKHPITTLPH